MIVHDRFLFSDISDKALRLLLVLRTYARQKDVAYPARKTLADRLGCSEDTIDRCLTDLVRAGAIRVEHTARPGGGRPVANYWLWPADPTQSRTDADLQSRTDAEIKPAPTRTQSRNGAGFVLIEEPEEGTNPSAPPSTSPRKRDPIFDALAEMDGINPALIATRGVGSRLGKAKRELMEMIRAEGLPEEPEAVARGIRVRAARYRERHPSWEFTAAALIKHWPELGRTAVAVTAANEDDLRRMREAGLA